MRFSISARLVATIIGLTLFTGADWLQFRGTLHRSVAPDDSLPTVWTTDEDARENVAWSVDLPGKGVSGPIVVDGNVIVTCSSGFREDRLHVLCFDAASGKRRWERQFWATGRTLCHPTSAVAAPTPASDGRNIYAFYSSNDLICLDLDGNLKWLRGLTHDYPRAANDVGMASSPVVVDDTVVVLIECQGDSFVAGIDAATGLTKWRRPRRQDSNWSSPVVDHDPQTGGSVVLLQNGNGVSAHDPSTGEIRWRYDDNCSSIASATVDEGIVYVPSSGKLVSLKPTDGDVVQALWSDNRLAASNASPVVDRGRVYTVNGAGVLTCADAATAESIWKLRLKGPFWATPVIAGNYLYHVNQDGLAHVVELGETEGKLVAKNEFGEAVLASPAVADGALYVRSASKLWKIAQDP